MRAGVNVELLPTQAASYDRLLRAARASAITALKCPPGMGASTLLSRLAAESGALFLDPRSISGIIRSYPAFRWDDVLIDLIRTGLEQRGSVVIDSLPDIVKIGSPRHGYFQVALRHLNDLTIRSGKHFVYGGNFTDARETARFGFDDATAVVNAPALAAVDLEVFFTRRFGVQRCARLDFMRLHRVAPLLDLHQLRFLVTLLDQQADDLTNEVVEAVIEKKVLRSNLNTAQVEALSFDNLPGSEHIAQVLETHVVLPLVNKQLASSLDLKPRRGVLLYGPPGTGKTSIGRALAHRIQGRFFLIDGSFITEPPTDFMRSVTAIVEEAKKSSPSVLFIDDADVLFQIRHIAGLSRFLLSLLDGIESETARNVCVMMTAMDPAKVPQPLLRSGRVELWLETKAPDEATRTRIFERWMEVDMPGRQSVDYPSLARQTEGFTPADIRRLAGDAKLLYAADLAQGRKIASASDYLQTAIDELIALRSVMAKRLSEDRLRVRRYA